MDILKCTIIAVIISAVVGLGSYKNVGNCKMANMMPTTEQNAMNYNGQFNASMNGAIISAIINTLPKIIEIFNGNGDKKKK